MTTVATLPTLDAACLLRSWLEGNGVPSSIPDEFSQGSLTPLQGLGGVRLQVAEEWVEKAREVIAEYGREEGE